MNFVSHMCEIRFNDVIGQSTVPMYSKHGWPTWPNEYVLESIFFCFFCFFNLIRWIQLCDKKYLTFVDCYDKILLNSS